MARMARVVVPFIPHHVTQRGNRRQRTFFSDQDYSFYIRLLQQAAEKSAIDVWAYCLMPNHVHFVVVPRQPDSLAQLFSDAHRRYTRFVNKRQGWQGHLWQERFHSSAMDESYLLAAVRYTELNPVRASLCESPEQWPWSSVHAHLSGQDDDLVSVEPMLQRVSNWTEYLGAGECEDEQESIRRHAKTGRPMGSEVFISALERLTNRQLLRARPGPKKAIK